MSGYDRCTKFFARITRVFSQDSTQVGDRVEAEDAIARLHLPGLGRETRLARARLALLEDGADGAAPEALAAARAALREREAIEQAGTLIVSPFAREVVAHNLVRGQAVAAGTVVAHLRAAVDGWPEAVALAAPAEAQRVDVGMPARVALQGTGGERSSRSLEAEVREIAGKSAPAPGWLAAMGLDAGQRGQLVRFVLREAQQPLPVDGANCVARIVLDRHAPIRLLAPRAFD